MNIIQRLRLDHSLEVSIRVRLPSKRAPSQEILFAVFRFWSEQPNGHNRGRIDDTQRLFALRVPLRLAGGSASGSQPPTPSLRTAADDSYIVHLTLQTSETFLF